MSTISRHIRGPAPLHRSSSVGTTKTDEAYLVHGGPISAGAYNTNSDYFARYPTSWSRYRSATYTLIVRVLNADASYSDILREPAAEMLGTMMLTLVGNATNCQVVLSTNSGVASSQKGDYLSLGFGWACSL
jgi:hypothetical protein